MRRIACGLHYWKLITAGWVTVLAGLFLSACLTAAGAEAGGRPIRALIVTGIDYPGHHWKETTPVLKEELGKDSRFRVQVLEDPYQLDRTDLFQYDVLVLHFMNWEKADPSAQAEENLRRFVESGGGLVIIHFACGAFHEWQEYSNLAGRIYDKVNTHDPRGPFHVSIVSTNHPVTVGLQPFETDDELYICLTGNKPVEVLASARSKVTQRDHPMALAHHYGTGRVFLTPLGHDARALRYAGTAELIRRGTAWAAGRSAVNEKDRARMTEEERIAIEKQFKVPEGFEVRLAAAEPDIINPISICVDERGALWVTEAHSYRWGAAGSPFQPPTNPIKRIELGPDGRAQRSVAAAAGFSEPVMGVQASRGKLFATCLNELFVMDIAADGSLSNRRLLVKDAAVPWNPFGMYRVQLGPDDKLWLSIGDHPGGQGASLTGTDGRKVQLSGRSGGLVRCNRDGTGLEIVADGFRAPFAFDIDPWGHIWQISNGEGSPNIYVHVIPGVDYGYASRQASYAWLAGQEPLSPPVRDMGAGANTAALHYFSAGFPEEYWGNILIANWGSHGANPANRQITRWRRARGAEARIGTGDSELVEAGIFLSTTDPLFRPTSIVVAPNGGIYVLDWHGRDDENDTTGRILKISHRGGAARFEASREADAKRLGPSVLVKKLSAPDARVRSAAREALAKANAVEILGDAAERENALGAAMAIWSLNQISSAGAVDAMRRGLKHPDPRVRAQTVRQLRQLGGQSLAGEKCDGAARAGAPLITPEQAAEAVSRLIQDPDAEVRVEAALAQTAPAEVCRGLSAALEVATDWRLIYQIGFQLGQHADVELIRALARSTNSAWKQTGRIAIDTAREKNTPLLAAIKQRAPPLLEETPPAEFKAKIAWMERHSPGLLAAEFQRLERGELFLDKAGEFLAALECLARCRNVAFPKGFVAASLEQQDANVRRAALRVMTIRGVRGDEWVRRVLRLARETRAGGAQLDAIFVLGQFDDCVPVEDWMYLVESTSDEISTAAVRSMRQSKPSGRLVSALQERASTLAARNAGLSGDLALTLQMFGAQLDRCGLEAAMLTSSETKADLEKAVLARMPRSSANLGRLSFYSARVGCASCHATQRDEKCLGPNLAEVGSGSTAQYLVESILSPSKVIKSGFQSERIELADGDVVSGLVEGDGARLIVNTSAAERLVLPMQRVKRRQPSAVSLMPEGLELTMSERELGDVLAYLGSRKAAQ